MRFTNTKDPEYMEDQERISNRRSVKALIWVIAVLFIVFLLNLTGVFELSQKTVNFSLASAVTVFILLELIVRMDRYLTDRSCKYILLAFTLLLTGILTTLLNINAALALLIPMLLATQYRSERMTCCAIAGSCVIGLVYPVTAYCFGTFDLNYFSGFFETVFEMKILAASPSAFTEAENIGRLFLYLGLPQFLILAALGFFILSITRNRIEAADTAIHAKELDRDLATQQHTLDDLKRKALDSMADILENRDVITGEHVKRTVGVVQILTREMLKDPDSGMSIELAYDLVRSASLHDIGKIAISDNILNKPGELTDTEFDIIRTHPERSASIIEKALSGLSSESFMKTAVNTAMYHHERFDGQGYPCGLMGKDIPLEARIMAVADVYDALISERSYKKALTYDEVYAMVIGGMGSQFDPDLAEYFISARNDLEEFYMTINNTEKKEQKK